MKRDLPLADFVQVHEHLRWNDALGIGIGSPAQEAIYNISYWNKYRRYDADLLGKALTKARKAFVETHAPKRYGVLLDVGIGGGLFCYAINCHGYDVNPYAVHMLKQAQRWHDPWLMPVESATFWDSLEHMNEPELMLENVCKYVFVSMPIYRNVDHCLHSKHFRPHEHVWYFTRDGFVRWMLNRGFVLLAESDFEIDLGREDIYSFAFMRKP